jgi:hypothetical protein
LWRSIEIEKSRLAISSTPDKDQLVLPGDLSTDWYNFGFWDPDTKEFEKAAMALAFKLGQLAELNNCSHLLDVGPGYGAQLTLWKNGFQVQKITALEPNQAAWQRASTYEEEAIAVYCSKLEDYPANPDIRCVVAVDSCYHIPYNVIWNKLQHLSGLQKVVFSDLFLLRVPSIMESVILRVITMIAKIPYQNFRTKDVYCRTSQMHVVSWDDVSVQVVDGFCKFVGSEIGKRSISQRFFSSQLLKVFGTACLLRWLRTKGLIGYALIVLKPI